MTYIISYDISDDNIRLGVGKLLEGFGLRVQKSVFECRISDTYFAEIRKTIAGMIDKETDNVRYYRLCRKCETEAEFYGEAVVEDDCGFFIV
ncbi:MAG: CRISPR-associated endonuclease Cas2 [Candidatus Magnetoovum sp. WYHC-5]|nr:CRISPR-associated endonuclease Cas2 [Candidatus Magnetoovum sp. WYHC-5]